MEWIVERIVTEDKVRKANLFQGLPEWWLYSLSPSLKVRYISCIQTEAQNHIQSKIQWFLTLFMVSFLFCPSQPHGGWYLLVSLDSNTVQFSFLGSLSKITEKFLLLLEKRYWKSFELMMLLELVGTQKEECFVAQSHQVIVLINHRILSQKTHCQQYSWGSINTFLESLKFCKLTSQHFR